MFYVIENYTGEVLFTSPNKKTAKNSAVQSLPTKTTESTAIGLLAIAYIWIAEEKFSLLPTIFLD